MKDLATGTLLLLFETAAANITFDLFFKYMAIKALPGKALHYASVGAVCWIAGLAAGWALAGMAGVAAVLPAPAVWWMLWRFGLRKQLTYLFKDDGGSPMDAQKPDP